MESRQNKVYRIYSHNDADGGIAAAIFCQFLSQKYGKYNWNFEIIPVQHDAPQGTPWVNQVIQLPCAILDFSLHPMLLSKKFFTYEQQLLQAGLKPEQIPPCYWIDHHATGSLFEGLTNDNLPSIMPAQVKMKWDTSARSTPGLFRTHYKELNIPEALIHRYAAYIDMAEVIDGALYASAEASCDFFDPIIQLQTLFSHTNPFVKRDAIYKALVQQIMSDPNPEHFMDSNPLFPAIIESERRTHCKIFDLYKKHTWVEGCVAVADFSEHRPPVYMGRFIPYVLFPDVSYSIHVLPKFTDQKTGKTQCSLSCGVNPWNKQSFYDNPKNIGNFMTEHFGGGGHAFVAGGRMMKDEMYKIKKLLEYLNHS